MKYLFAAAILLLLMADAHAQPVYAKPVTLTSYVYGNRYCARLPILGIALSKTFSADTGEDIPAPTGDCVATCTSDGYRYLVRSLTIRALHIRQKMR